MEERWSLDYPLDFSFQSENKISKHVKMPVATIIHNIEEHHVSKLLSDINFDTVQDLVLSRKKLIDLPEDFGFHFVNLARLDLSENNLTTVPHSLKFISSLKHLFLNDNSFFYLPPTVTEIKNLTELNLANNSMTSVPDSLANLESLQVFNLAYNNLSELPSACQKWSNLKILNLTGNRLTRIPECVVAGMAGLQDLDLSENSNINLSDAPASKKLRQFRARNAGNVVAFPTWILTGDAPSLEKLDLDGTKFEPFQLPEKRANLRLKILSVRHCGIYGVQLEKMLRSMQDLGVLRVANAEGNYGGYGHLPMDRLEFPEKMTEIDLSSTGLSFVPDSIENFVNLVKLNLGHNALRWLPEKICKLRKLEILNLKNNSLSHLPHDLGDLNALTELWADKNKISFLPDSAGNLRNLVFLDLYENAFTCVPKTLSSMENLKGFDIDYNPVYISDLCINGTKYARLRQTLRQRCAASEFPRATGAWYGGNFNDSSDTSSEISSTESCHSQSKSEGNLVGESTQNWDISDDSADDYDPTCDDGKTTKKKWCNFFYAPANQNLFCPAILHAMPIRQQMIRLKEQGLLEEKVEAEVEGQFEDA